MADIKLRARPDGIKWVNLVPRSNRPHAWERSSGGRDSELTRGRGGKKCIDFGTAGSLLFSILPFLGFHFSFLTLRFVFQQLSFTFKLFVLVQLNTVQNRAKSQNKSANKT